MNQINCICCDRVLDAEPIDNPMVISPIYNGLIFRATGNFGSIVFDPMPIQKKEMLQVIICDSCIKEKAKWVTLLYNIKEERVAKSREFTP